METFQDLGILGLRQIVIDDALTRLPGHFHSEVCLRPGMIACQLVDRVAARLEAVTTKANTVAVNTDGAQQQAVASLASSAPNMAGVLSTERQDIEGKSPE